MSKSSLNYNNLEIKMQILFGTLIVRGQSYSTKTY